MNFRELKKSTEELKLKSRETEDIINLKKQRIDTIKENSLGMKVALMSSISIIVYAVFLVLIVLKGTSILPSSIPSNLISPIIALTSIASGVVGEKLLEKLKGGNKKTSRNNVKELEEKIKLEIELEMSKNKNIALEQAIEILKTNEIDISSIPTETNVINSTLKEENVQELELDLEQQYKKLDELTIKKFLSDKFFMYEDKVKPLIKVLSISVMTAIGATVIFGIPNVLLDDLLTYSNMYSSLLSVTSPLVLGGIMGGLYTIKNNKDNKKVYNKLKEKFNLNDFDSKFIEKEIGETITNISELEIKIQKIKRTNEKALYIKEEQEKNNKNILSTNRIQTEIIEDSNLEIEGPVRKIGQKK